MSKDFQKSTTKGKASTFEEKEKNLKLMGGEKQFYVMAWPTAEIAVMGAEGACNIIYRTEIKSAADPEAKRAELIAAYEDKFNNPYFAASMGIIEEIIAPHDTRKKIVALLDALKDKKEVRLPKKHNNIPL